MSDTAIYAERLADDALIAGQRLCEWCSRAPSLEEDLALSNIGLNYLGRARLLYTYVEELTGVGEERLVFLKEEKAFGNALIAELPCGDFAFSMVRQFLVDAFDDLFFQALSQSEDAVLASIAEKTRKEVAFQKRRSMEWMRRLGLGTKESHTRAQNALNELCGYTSEMFEMDVLEQRLADRNVAVNRVELLSRWEHQITQVLGESQLHFPQGEWHVSGGRRGSHTEHMGYLLAELQFLPKAFPGLAW